jgi:hypothetical protein
MSESLPGLPAGLAIPLSITLLLSLSELPVVISEGKTPGAITLTLTFVFTNAVANILLKCVAAAFDEAYANCPDEVPFIAPEMEVTLMTEDVYPGVLEPPFASNGRNVIDMM